MRYIGPNGRVKMREKSSATDACARARGRASANVQVLSRGADQNGCTVPDGGEYTRARVCVCVCRGAIERPGARTHTRTAVLSPCASRCSPSPTLCTPALPPLLGTNACRAPPRASRSPPVNDRRRPLCGSHFRPSAQQSRLTVASLCHTQCVFKHSLLSNIFIGEEIARK